LESANDVPTAVEELNNLVVEIQLQLDFLGLLIGWQGLE